MRRGSPPDHILLSGPPGLGKTSLANIVAAELGTGHPGDQRPGDRAFRRPGRDPDQPRRGRRAVHRRDPPDRAGRPRSCSTARWRTSGSTWWSARAREPPPSRSTSSRSRWSAPPPASGLLTGPMRDRFGFVAHLDFYTPADLEALLHRSARILGVPITARGRGRDRRPVPGHARGSPTGCCAGCATTPRCGPTGWSPWRSARAAPHRLRRGRAGAGPARPGGAHALVDSFRGGPVGLSTLAVAVGEQPDTVEEVCEPFLVRAGLLARTPRGRVATEAAWHHLGRTPPNGTFGTEAPPGPDLFSTLRPISRDPFVICTAFGLLRSRD